MHNINSDKPLLIMILTTIIIKVLKSCSSYSVPQTATPCVLYTNVAQVTNVLNALSSNICQF